MPSFPDFPRIDKFVAKQVFPRVANVATLGAYKDPQGAKDYVGAILHQLNPNSIVADMTSDDPRKRDEGARRMAEFAATFFPNPSGKGGRFYGPLTPEQKAMMAQLNNVKSHRTYPIGKRDDPGAWRTSYPRHMQGIFDPVPESKVTSGMAQRDIALSPIYDQMGFAPSGTALRNLLNRTGGYGEYRKGSKLGTNPDLGMPATDALYQRYVEALKQADHTIDRFGHNSPQHQAAEAEADRLGRMVEYRSSQRFESEPHGLDPERIGLDPSNKTYGPQFDIFDPALKTFLELLTRMRDQSHN